MVLQIFRKDFGTSQAACGLDNRSIPIRDTKSSMGRKCGKHKIERHLLDGKTGPGGNQSNGGLRVDSRSTRPRGLDVKFLKDLNGESKIGSQKDLPGDRTLFGLLLCRANSVQQYIRINEDCHDDEVLRVLSDEKLRSIQFLSMTPPADVPTS
jgi:hypothetical protein